MVMANRFATRRHVSRHRAAGSSLAQPLPALEARPRVAFRTDEPALPPHEEPVTGA